MERKSLRRIAYQEAHRSIKRSIRRAWIAAGIAGALLCAAAIIYLSSLVSPKHDLAAEAPPAPGPSGRIVLGDIVREAEICYRGYLAAPGIEQRLAFVHDPVAAGPRMRQYYSSHPLETGELVEIFSPNAHQAGDRHFLIGNAAMRDGSDTLCVFELIKDEPKLVWEVAVGYSDMDWDEFIAKQVRKPTLFRVMLNRSDYYNYDFSDPEEHLCFRLGKPGEERQLYAYVEVGSPAWNRFLAVRSLSVLPALPVMVRIRFPDQPRSENQVLIDEFTTFSWVDGVEM
ncbi:MAG TPA: hypothetical protein VMN36_06315 [Verrucomicrobiales bacterium]|nr:hypothetical protein [Verrucomicrobiales bacterium]